MKRRFTALLTTLAMLVCQPCGMTVFAEDGRNAYGHRVTYEPTDKLYTDGKEIKLFDAAVSEWENVDENIRRSEEKSITWLSENGYLLNRFGRKYSEKEYTPGCFNANGEWKTQLKGPTNVYKWYANVSFDALSDKSRRENGNISNVYEKGDLQYFFSWKVKTVQTKWGLFGKSNDTGITSALGETTNSSGGGWKKYNTFVDGPNFGNASAWKSGKKLKYISFIALSDKDKQVDSYLSGAILVGRDSKGPRISSVKVSADADGKEEIADGAITLDTLENKLTNRTVYFRVEWDEPVLFKNLSQSDIEKLTLDVETIGIDGTSGSIADAPFLKFVPTKTDAKPVMVFEYKIADPYTDSSKTAQERGYFYKFTNVTVSENRNAKIWNNIYDVSGNKFGADEDGRQPSAKVVTPVSGAPYADLMPFGIKNIRIEKEPVGDDAFVKAGEAASITLELNKEIPHGTDIYDLPTITLNVKDTSGNYVTIAPSKDDLARMAKVSGNWGENGYLYVKNTRVQPVMMSGDRKSITYYIQLYPEYTLESESIKVTNVTVPRSFENPNEKRLKDNSGYSFMDYALSGGMLTPTDMPRGSESKISDYQTAPDKQYRFDFDAPVIDEINIKSLENIISVSADIKDKSLEGCDVLFTVRADGIAAANGLSYQAAKNENYGDSDWVKGENGSLIASFGAPVVVAGETGSAYGFIKLPEKCETDKINVSVTVIDEAKNSSSAESELSSADWDGYDTLAPRIKLSVKDEKISAVLSDADENVAYDYGFSNDESTQPQSFDAVSVKSGETSIVPAPDLPDENAVFERVLWIKAKDSRGNESEFSKSWVKYDRTYTDITVKINTTPDSDGVYKDTYPEVNFKPVNASSYWYMWAEIPANVPNTADYIEKNCLETMKEFAAEQNQTYEMPSEGLSYIPLTSLADSKVALIGGDDEKYTDIGEPSRTSRPVMLVIGAVREDDTTLVKTLEFDTFYGAPKARVRQTRFSTNDVNGNRVDYMKNGGNAELVSASDEYENPLNTPSVFGFAQAEFSLDGDPITGLDRVDTDKSYITLEKNVYTETWDGTLDEKREVAARWDFSEIGFSDGAGSAVIDIDPKSLNTKYFEIDENGTYYAVRYEFVCNMNYKGGFAETREPIAYFAFDNEPQAYLYETSYYSDHGYGGYYMMYHDFWDYEVKNTPAVFDKSGKDITENVPVYPISTSYCEEYGYDEYINFAALGGYADKEYFSSPVINTDGKTNTSKMKVHIGTNPQNLDTCLDFNSGYDTAESGYYDVGQYLFGNADEIREVKLYYAFEYPERGIVSPTYVMILRRDNTGPIIDMTISETEKITSEVLVKINGIHDTQTSGGITVTDTPDSYLDTNTYIKAYRAANENDNLGEIPDEEKRTLQISYDEETGSGEYADYVMLYPDDGGIYRFNADGFFEFFCNDLAENRCETLLINGEPTEVKMTGDSYIYRISNVSNIPPKFKSAPVFAEDTENGKFSVSAAADETVKNVYVKFDGEYAKALAQENSGAAADDGLYGISDVPGIFSGGFDAENGSINAEIYVKPNAKLSQVTVIIENGAGAKNEYEYNFTAELIGKTAEIKNTKNENGYPIYGYGEMLDFTVPVKIDGMQNGYALSHENLAIYSDGITKITYTDLFGTSGTENVYADIFGAAFAHDLKFYSRGEEITSQTKVNSDITVKIDASKTKNLSAVGNGEFSFSDNGILKYSLTNSDIGKTKEFSVPITNIDKTPPEAIVSVSLDSERDPETNALHIYSATYTVEGFSEDGVTLIGAENGGAPSSVTFDKYSENRKYVFKFRDEAGNENSYTADASEIAFKERTDGIITDYRLTYMTNDSNGFKTIGEYTSGKTADIGVVNKAISVKIEALNKNGETVSASVSQNGDLPLGTAVYAKEKLIVFSTESGGDRVVNITLNGIGSGNSINVPVTLYANTIDLTPPSGTVDYSADGNTVKAYLVTNDKDLAEVSVIGMKNDDTALELKTDENNNYYTEFDANGRGSFVMADKAGNVGNVAIAVLTIDNEPPKIVSEGWQSVIDGIGEKIEEILKTPTNGSIKLFITFDEQLGRAEVEAFADADGKNRLADTDEYVTALSSGRTLTVEFKKNCCAKITVYDLRGNAYSLIRPESGPITVIDKEIPKLKADYPKLSVIDNKAVLEYVFENGENVKLLKDGETEYKNRHIVEFSQNGTKILNFADKAGNVYTDYPVISEIDTTAPSIAMSVDYVGDGNVLSGNDSYVSGNVYTSKNVRILLRIEDERNEKAIVSAKTKSGNAIEVSDTAVEVSDGNGGKKTYNYSFIVSENGSYTVTAEDKWGNKNTVETSVSVIDKTAPVIKFNKNTLVLKSGTDVKDAEEKILDNIQAYDLQSGADNPMGDRKLDNVTDGVTVSADLGALRLDKEGSYTVTVTARDRLLNETKKDFTVIVLNDAYTFDVNGSLVYANDVFTAPKGKIKINNADENAKYYYSKGYKTAAQMKYAKAFSAKDGFDAEDRGYYTVLVKEDGRKMYLLYVYIN